MPDILPTEISAGTGSQVDFSVPFPYLRQAHVGVLVNGAAAAFTFLNESTVRLAAAPGSGAEVVRYRTTPQPLVVTLQNNVPTPAADYNTGLKQAMYYSQEQAYWSEANNADLLAQTLAAAAAATVASDAAVSNAAAVAADRLVVAADKAQVSADRIVVAADKATATAAATTSSTNAGLTAADRVAVAADKVTVVASASVVAADRLVVAAEKGTVAADRLVVAADKGTVAADKALVAADKGTVAADKATVIADKALVSADKTATLGYKNDAAASAAAALVSETNAGAIAAGALGPAVAASTAKGTPVDADSFAGINSAASNALMKVTWASIKATLKAYYDTLYATVSHVHAASGITSGTLADARLPSRLVQPVTTLTDFNALPALFGMNFMSAAANAPNANSHFAMQYGTSAFNVIMALDVSAAGGYYMRTTTGSAVGPWDKLLSVNNYAATLGSVYAAAAHTHTFAAMTSKPTTLMGYGITDAEAADASIVKSGTTKNFTVGYTSTAVALGSIATGTLTPTPATGNMQAVSNAGAHTLAAPALAGDYTMVLHYTNATGAGAVTASGFTKFDGDAFTTTVGHKFIVSIVKVGASVYGNVKAMQ